MTSPIEGRSPEGPAANAEREVDAGFDLANLPERIDDYNVSRPTLVSLRAVYYDTADLRLARAGFSLRYRDAEGWTLKVPFDRAELAAPRGELPFAGDPSCLPSEALRLLEGVVRGRPVVQVAELRTLRRRSRVDAIAEVSDDDVSVVRDGRVVERFRHAEVAALEGADPARFEALAGRLQAPGDPIWAPKLERALGLHDLGAAEGLDAEAPARALVSSAIASRLANLLRYDVLIRLRNEPEDVHRARSTVRRLRAILRGFRSWLDRTWADTLREELRWVAAELGAVRDIDVALASLRSHAREIAGDDVPYVAQALGPLTRARDEALQRLLRELSSGRYFRAIDEIEAAAEDPKLLWGGPATARELAEQVLREASRRARKAVRRAGSGRSPGELHHARIQVRNGRYAAEACAPIAGKRAKRLARRLTRIQDVLGAIHDAQFVQERLRESFGEAHVLLVAGQLLALEALDGEKARRAWKDLRRHALRERWADV